jgi:HlyD family secretion protein
LHNAVFWLDIAAQFGYGIPMNYETSITSSQDSSYQLEGSESKNGKRLAWLILAVIILSSVGVGVYYYLSQKNASPAAADTAKKDDKIVGQSVTVVSPGSDTVARIINATGTLAARNEVPIGVVGEGGQVSRVFVDAGDWVKQGQVLVSIDRSVQTQQTAALQAQIGVARADLQLAENELQRALQLVGRGFISKADVDRKTATRDSARARVNVANAQLNENNARNARLDIRAPISGYILERKVETGQTVSAGSGILFRVAQNGEMELQALLGEAELSSISVGIGADVTPVGEAKQFSGRIWQISPMIDATSRQGMARIALPFDRELRPGGFANVQIQAGATTAPVLPESAIQNDKDGSFVYLIGADNKTAKRRVKTGGVTANGIPVLEGLVGTERVVLRAGSFLSEGEVVKPVFEKK